MAVNFTDSAASKLTSPQLSREQNKFGMYLEEMAMAPPVDAAILIFAFFGSKAADIVLSARIFEKVQSSVTPEQSPDQDLNR